MVAVVDAALVAFIATCYVSKPVTRLILIHMLASRLIVQFIAGGVWCLNYTHLVTWLYSIFVGLV